MKLCLDNQIRRIADNTEPSPVMRNWEGVETKGVPSLGMGDDDIVRSAWRHAESGRNGLTLWQFAVLFKASQFRDYHGNVGLFGVGVLLTCSVHNIEEFPKQCQLLSLFGGQNAAAENLINPTDILFCRHLPRNHRQFSVASGSQLIVDMPTKMLLDIFQYVLVVISQRNTEFGTETNLAVVISTTDGFSDCVVVMHLHASFAPEKATEFSFPKCIIGHENTSYIVMIPYIGYDLQESNKKDTSYDLEGDSNITNVWVTGGGLGKGPDYFDATFKDLPLGFRYYESTIAPITRASGYTDYYTTFVLGAEAYGTAELSSMPAKVITHLPGTSGVSDPLDQVATVGWKANFASVILNQNNLVRIVHQASVFTGTRSDLL